MRYRALDVNGDMTFGSGFTSFLVNSPAAVAQAILTRLQLFAGEWFLDTTEGTPYATQILGTGTAATRDDAVRNRILGTQGVVSLQSYSSELGPVPRQFVVNATVNTIYGPVDVSSTLAVPIPQPGVQPGQYDFSSPDNSAFIGLA